MQHTYSRHGLPHGLYLEMSWAPPMVFVWNAMGFPRWSNIQMPRAPPGSSMQVSQRQLAYHITSNGLTFVPSTHGYSEKTHLVLLNHTENP